MRRVIALLLVVLAGAAAFYVIRPYARAASLVVRAADLGGRAELLAALYVHPVDVRPPHVVPTRHGDVRAQLYVPTVETDRSVLVMPGFNTRGIDEPRLQALAADLAATGVTVMALALPDLQRFRITPASTDVIEDTVAWMAAQPELAPDGRVGAIGVSFTGGLTVAAAGREAIRDKLAFVVSLGGHGDLRRVMRYLATGDAPQVQGVEPQPPHDYGVAVVLYALADRGVVPRDQVPALREAIETFLLASQLTVTDAARAEEMFARARQLADKLPEPSRTYMRYVNERTVAVLGSIVSEHLRQLDAGDPALSPELAPTPSAPVYLLHGRADTIVPAAESVLLAEHLRNRGADVELLLTNLITHAQPTGEITPRDAWELIAFWADVLRR